MEEINQTNDSDAVYILDSYGLIYRAYFALITHPLTNTKKENISAVVIFFKNLRSLLSRYKPKYLYAAFDSRTPTFRHEMYKEYKATRDKTPEDLHAQVPWIENILTGLGIPVLRMDGYEADDIIATVVAKCKAEGRQCRILSADKDLLQLVDDYCKAMQPDKENGGWITQGAQEVTAKWGIGPDKILDYLSLVGDTADNVPGVKGVGDKTALKLLNEYQTLEGIYQHKDEIKGALGNKIRNDEDNAFFSKKLITLKDDVPVEIDFSQADTSKLDYDKAASLLAFYGATQVAKTYGKADASIKPDSVQDVSSPAEEEIQVEIRQNKGNYKAVTQLKELTAFVDAILNSSEKIAALDTETTSLDTQQAELVGFSLCYKAGEAIYVPVMLEAAPGEMFAPETISKEDCIKEISRLFECNELTLVMHNAKYDLEVLHHNGLGKDSSCQITDTMIAAWLLNPDATGKNPYSLEYLGETKLGLKGIEFSDIVPKGKTFDSVPLEKAYEYGAEDADFTFQLWTLLRKKLNERGLDDLYYNMELKVLPILTAMEEEGIHLDNEELKAFSKELDEQIKQKEEQIFAAAGHEFNISSTKQLQTVLFEERGLVPGKKTKTGYSTDTAVLEELSERTTDPIPALVLEYRSFTKLKSTYVETLPLLTDMNGKIHTSFLQTGTATGRLSSRDPNLQNIPVRDDNGRRIRQAFTAQDGKVFISADYAQIELVVLAHLSQDKNLCKSFIDGTDVHKATAALIYGVSPEEVSAEQRRFAKTVNFGVMYGMSAFRLAKDLDIPVHEGKKFIDQYFATYSDVRKFLDDTINSAHENGYVETIMGRRRYINGISSKSKLEQQGAERVAINTPIQGSAADIVKKAMIATDKALRESGSPAKMLLQVHDELIFECPDDEATINKTLDLIRSSMENAVKLSVPLRVSIEYGKSWGEFH